MIELNGTIIAVILNFLILVWILNYFLYKPVRDILLDRKKTVEDNISQSEDKLKKASEIKQQYESQLAAVAQKAQEIIKNATVTADRIRGEASESAKLDAAFIRTQAEKESEQLKLDACTAARKDISSLVCAAAAKLMKKTIDEKTNKPLIDDLIREVEGAQLN